MRAVSERPRVATSRLGLAMALVGAMMTPITSAKAEVDASLRRHWDPAFDVPLPNGVSSDDLEDRCWTKAALDSYVTEGRLWLEDVYGLPYGYVERHCLREQLTNINAALNGSYARLLRSLGPSERRRTIAAERAWIALRNSNCNVADGISYVMLGSFVCLMNMTDDRIRWISSHR